MSAWLDQWFSGTTEEGTFRVGDLGRRARTDVDKYSSIEDAIKKAREQGWHLLEAGGQVVLIRDDGPFQIYC
jgi:hypothetical protein